MLQLTADQQRRYDDDGFLVVEDVFDEAELRPYREAFERDRGRAGVRLVREEKGQGVRSVYGSYKTEPIFEALVRSPRLLAPARQLLGTEQLYTYQFKINSKAPFLGSGWSWHQDFLAWKIADGLRRPCLLNVGVYLDEVSEFNGPLIFLPGSHRGGLIRDVDQGLYASGAHLDPRDISLTPEQLTEASATYGMVSAKGKAGTVVFFGAEIVHGSAQNVSPWPRTVVIITYNEVTNAPPLTEVPRPSYLVGRDTNALELADEPDRAVA